MLIILILLILEIYLKKLTMTLVKLKKNGNKYINSQEFIKLTSENFAGRLLIL